jgi:hypothetical protein
VAAVADATICPILTPDAAKWRQYAKGLDEPPHIIEIADPDEAPEGRAGDRALGRVLPVQEACSGPVRPQSADGRDRSRTPDDGAGD